MVKSLLIRDRNLDANLQTYQVGARFKSLKEGVLMAPLDSRYTQVGFNLISFQVCTPGFGAINFHVNVACGTSPAIFVVWTPIHQILLIHILKNLCSSVTRKF